jgi:hypothetical protein
LIWRKFHPAGARRRHEFAVSAAAFPVCNEDFPVRIAGNSSKQVSCFNGFVRRGGGFAPQIPCIFPDIREVQSARLVRHSLPAQPPSRSFFGSLPTFTEPCRRSLELRDQFAGLHWDVPTERAFQWKKAASLPVYLYWAFSGVTLRRRTDGLGPQPSTVMEIEVCSTFTGLYIISSFRTSQAMVRHLPWSSTRDRRRNPAPKELTDRRFCLFLPNKKRGDFLQWQKPCGSIGRSPP